MQGRCRGDAGEMQGTSASAARSSGARRLRKEAMLSVSEVRLYLRVRVRVRVRVIGLELCSR